MSEPIFDPETDTFDDEAMQEADVDNDGPVELEGGQDDGS